MLSSQLADNSGGTWGDPMVGEKITSLVEPPTPDSSMGVGHKCGSTSWINDLRS